MIPFRDSIPSRRLPIVTMLLILVNVIAFIWELRQGPRLETMLFEIGVVPKKWLFLDKVPGFNLGQILPPYLYSLFLHGGWFHLVSNMWWLWIFGDNVEDRLGSFRFLIFYLLCGFFSGVVHTVFMLGSGLPAIGASGAVAGVLGAYFLLYPHAKIQTLIPFFFYYEIVELPALMVLGFWFVTQFLNGTATIAATSAGQMVAWWGHIGGFIAGAALVFFFDSGQKEETGI